MLRREYPNMTIINVDPSLTPATTVTTSPFPTILQPLLGHPDHFAEGRSLASASILVKHGWQTPHDWKDHHYYHYYHYYHSYHYYYYHYYDYYDYYDYHDYHYHYRYHLCILCVFLPVPSPGLFFYVTSSFALISPVGSHLSTLHHTCTLPFQCNLAAGCGLHNLEL